MASSSNWTQEQDKLFENALVTFDKDPDWWQNTAKITGKTVEEVKIHYQELLDDLDAIESGRAPLPDYESDLDAIESGRVPLPDYESPEAKGSVQPENKK